MPTYVVLQELTREGIDTIEEGPDQLDEATDLAASMNCELRGYYLTFGQYDAVAILDAPDDETAAQFVLSFARDGTASTETLRAFPEAEYREIIDGLPG